MRWLIELWIRGCKRIHAHRHEAVVFAGFVALLTIVVRVAALASPIAGWLRAQPAAGVPGALLVAMTMAWLPLMVIDMKRCTRETALRKHVEADLEARNKAEQNTLDAFAAMHEKVSGVLANGGPRLVYQPIVNVADGGWVGFEALSRFDDGQCPADWFACAAMVGLGVELELAAVQRALADLRHLPSGVYLSVNVSPEVLIDPRLLELVRHVASDRVVVELTEHCAITDYGPCREAIRALREQGVRLAVDDAGAGYASLRHVLDLAPDVIKIDRSLVSGIGIDPARRSLFAALLTLATDMGAVLVAEGVETADEAQRLAQWGVPFAQGWHFGRPEPLSLTQTKQAQARQDAHPVVFTADVAAAV